MAWFCICRIRSPADVKVLADFFEGAGLTAFEPEAQCEDLAFAGRERCHESGDLGRQERRSRGIDGRGCGSVGDEIGEFPVAVLRKWLGKGHGVGRAAHERRELVFGKVEFCGDFGSGGAALEVGLEASPGVTGPHDVIAGMHGNPDGAGGIGNAAVDGLADPPRRIRRELEALAPLELVHSAQQPEVPLLDVSPDVPAVGRSIASRCAAGHRDDGPSVLARAGCNGNWTVAGHAAVLNEHGGRIAFQFHARDLNLVMGPSSHGASIPFRVFLDGQLATDAHGSDVNPDGSGTMSDQRTYQLIRQAGAIADRLFEVEFLDAGVEAYCFTFG
jgi:hypothetical protein